MTEPEPRNWEHMPPEMKEIIVDKMNIVTRSRFKQCSTESKTLVESRPISFEKVECDIVEDLTIGGVFDYCISFDGFKKTMRSVPGAWPVPLAENIHLAENVHRIPMDLMTILNEQVLAANIPIGHLKMGWDFPEQFMESGKFIKVKTIQLSCTKQKHNKLWLDHCVPGVDCAIIDKIYQFVDDEPNIGTHPIIMNAKTLELPDYFPLLDSHLELYKATHFHHLYCSDNYTDDVTVQLTVPGLVRLLKRWIRENYPIGAKFELRVCGDGTKNIESIMSHIRGAFYYSTTTRSYDNKVTIKAMISDDKYIEVVPLPADEFWHINGVVRRVEVIQEKEVNSIWNVLPEKFKMMIVKKMDIFTRTRLKVCSKEDKKLVESVPFHYSKLEVNDNGNYFFQVDDVLAIRCSQDEFTIFDENPKEEYEEKSNVRRRILYNSEEEALAIWRSIFNSFAKNENVRVDRCEIECDEREFFGSEGIGGLSTIMNAKHFKVSSFDITDDELLASKATQLKIKGNHCTSESIKQLINKWVQESYPVGSSFEIQFKFVKEYDEIFEGLELRRMDKGLLKGELKKVLIQMRDDKYMKVIIKKGEKCSPSTRKGFNLIAVGIII